MNAEDDIREQSRTSLVLAVARYLQQHPDAEARAGVWLDDDVRAAQARDIAAEADERLARLRRWTEEADPELVRTRNPDVLRTELNLQAARNGVFATAAGSLFDFLESVGEPVQALDEA
jgi:hypothetical protein